MSEATALHANPAPALEAAFRRVRATRMAGLPFLNERLAVEAVGFAPWKGHWLGVLVTPWFMNVVVAPRDAAQWRSLPPGEKRRYRFPAGEYDFVSAREDRVGEFVVCSLFSPVDQFEDQAAARFVAAHALAALLDPANDARAAPAGPGAVERSLAQPVSRRDVLRGRPVRDADDPGR